MDDVEQTALLLADVFPHARIGDADYLRWLYFESPLGSVIETNLDDDAGRAGHYALVPFGCVEDGQPRAGALSLNTAVHARARGAGAFVRLAEATYEQARRRGIETIVGVANANSTPGFVRRLGFECVAALPATVLVPTPGRPEVMQSARWTPEALARGDLGARVAALLTPPTQGFARVWTFDALRWRLGSPGARYAVHLGREAFVVSCADRRHGVNVAVILTVLAPRPLSDRSARAIVRSVCRFHRAPLALHVGFNDSVTFRGVPLPERLRESPA